MAQRARGVTAIWAEYGKTRSDHLRNRLMEHYLPLVRQIAQRVHAKLPREVELDDLVSAGVFGLMDAIAAYDPNRKVRFETYCGSRVRGAILDELRSWDWVPRLARLRAQKLLSVTQQARLELGRDPTLEELADRLQVPLPELKKILRDGNLIRVMSLSHPAPTAEGDDTCGELVEDAAAVDRFCGVERDELREIIAECLSRAEQLIIVLYYFEQMTMREIGLTLDLSESRVSQMHSSIVARLRKAVAERLSAAAAAEAA